MLKFGIQVLVLVHAEMLKCVVLVITLTKTHAGVVLMD